MFVTNIAGAHETPGRWFSCVCSSTLPCGGLRCDGGEKRMVVVEIREPIKIPEPRVFIEPRVKDWETRERPRRRVKRKPR